MNTVFARSDARRKADLYDMFHDVANGGVQPIRGLIFDGWDRAVIEARFPLGHMGGRSGSMHSQYDFVVERILLMQQWLRDNRPDEEEEEE